MPDFVLPKLPYGYADLEPFILQEIVELHHDKHHRSYVDGANKALASLASRAKDATPEEIGALERSLAFHASGHILHSLYWQNLTPDGGGKPDGELQRALLRDFGSFDRFKNLMNHAAASTMGSGWAALVLEPVSARLVVVQIHDHQSVTVQGSLPLMVLDAWEHAYYLQYKADKQRYFDAIWNLWNWDDVLARFVRASERDLTLEDAAQDVRGPPGMPSVDDVLDRI